MAPFVRKLRKADTAIWAQMRLKLWGEPPLDAHLGDIADMLRDKKWFAYIAFADDRQPAGFAELCIRDYANGATAQPVPFLEGIWVDPRHRRKGIGRALVAQITADLVGKGFRELCSDAEAKNRRSHRAHRGWGFDETERVVYFRKPLT